MAGNKKVSFTLQEGDAVDSELRKEFTLMAKSYGIPMGKFMSRAFYLACAELLGARRMEAELNHIRAKPDDPRKPLAEEFVVDTDAWRKNAEASKEKRIDREIDESIRRAQERRRAKTEAKPSDPER